MSDLGPGECPTCAVEPGWAPRRWCAPARCYCGHEACPAYVSGWVPLVRHLPVQPADDDTPLHPLEARVLAIARKPGHSKPPERLTHTDQLGEEWAQRDEPSWIDRL